MADYRMIDVEETPYLYNERSCSMEPEDIGREMGEAFGKVAAFIGEHGLTSMGRALSVYHTYDEDRMTFRAGFIVSAEDAKAAAGDVKADVLPGGRVLHFVHRGPYATLRDSYGDMMGYMAEHRMTIGSPSWEIYVNGPDDVASEEELETEIYVSVA